MHASTSFTHTGMISNLMPGVAQPSRGTNQGFLKVLLATKELSRTISCIDTHTQRTVPVLAPRLARIRSMKQDSRIAAIKACTCELSPRLDAQSGHPEATC